MIPKIIWQTYETPFKDLIPETKECVNTWKDQNPSWKYMYMDATERDDFVLHEFGEEWHNIFINCKLGIVKANIWRCMILYIYGGVYSDLDTICHQPNEEWIKEDFLMTLAKDDQDQSDEYCIYTIASQPNNPILKLILDNIRINIVSNNITINNVIELTGESIWTKIIDQLNNPNIYCYSKGSNVFNGKATTHLGTSKKWYKEGYIQWMRSENND